MEAQTQSNWCWAATSKSVSHFYSHLSPWTQCKIAADELSLTCCNSPLPTGCNVPYYLDRALTRTHNFNTIVSGTLTWDTVKAEIENGLVIGARIGWSGGGGHFMVIYGVSKFGSTEYLHIDDPIYGKSVLTYNDFSTNYKGSGMWTHSYYTKKYYYIMWFKDLVFNKLLLDPIYDGPPVIDPIGPVSLREKQDEMAFALPHYSYNIGLNDLKSNRSLTLPSSASALRIIRLKNNDPKALYELSPDEQSPGLKEINTDEKYFGLIDQGLERLKNVSSDDKNLPELRHIRVPALNIEALWLHREGKDKNSITLIRHLYKDIFDYNKVYSEKEFFDLLKKVASGLKGMDDTMGA
ncbi:MAG TPA: papain-like cysteine protease family protein [Bacteroidia bacterium]|nr:papain-like cysteine protease family protein [Bacteroidia bacterium]